MADVKTTQDSSTNNNTNTSDTSNPTNNDDPMRDRVRTLLEGIVGVERDAINMERSVYNWCLRRADEASQRIAKNWRNTKFRALYEAKARSVLCNIDPTAYVGNATLLQRVLDGEFEPRDIADVCRERAFPERWKEAVDLKAQREEYIINSKPSSMTDQFKCGRCKNRQTTFVEVQLRSADEPATLFIQCIVCGHRWRLG
jgi:transcription elongation factor S-II